MKWASFVFYLLILFSCSPKNQKNKTADEFPKDSTEIWINVAKVNDSLSKVQRLKLLKKAERTIKQYPVNKKKTSSLSQLSLAYQGLGDSISFFKTNKELISLSQKINDKKAHGEAHWDLGSFFNLRQPDSSIYHYREAYQLFLNAKLDSNETAYPGRMLYSIANIKDNNRDYAGAEKDIVRAIKYYQDNNNKDRLFAAYNLLAILQTGMEKFDKALEYHTKAKEFIPFSRKGDRFDDITTNTNNIASNYLNKGDYTQAISTYNLLLQTDSLFQKRASFYVKANSGLAYAKFKNGDSDYDLLIQEFDKGNKILDSLGSTYNKARNYEYKAQVLAKIGDIHLAIENALQSEKIAEETSNNDRLLSSLKLLTTLDKKNSAKYAKDYFKLSEELQSKERRIQDKFARIELETDAVIEENESLARQRETLAAVAIALMLLGVGVFVIINQRAKNLKLKFQQTQQESNKEIYNLMLSQQGKFQEGRQLEQKRISEEIHDGILGEMLGIRLILSGLNERDDDAAISQRAELIEKLKVLEEEMRTISHELNSAAYNKVNNYIMAVKDLVNNVALSSKMAISFNFSDSFDWDILEGDIKINTYRIIQECLQNCVKHAKCANVILSLVVNEDIAVLKIVDDGIGFNPNKGKKGIGLKNITSRIKNIKGDLKIKSLLGKGTEIIINVPLIYTTTSKDDNRRTTQAKALEA